MPTVKCVLCGEEFAASRSTKMYCGCNEKRRPLGFNGGTQHQGIRRVDEFEHSKANMMIKEQMRERGKDNEWEVRAGRFHVKVTYED